jgi:hypothetical protein
MVDAVAFEPVSSSEIPENREKYREGAKVAPESPSAR